MVVGVGGEWAWQRQNGGQGHRHGRAHGFCARGGGSGVFLAVFVVGWRVASCKLNARKTKATATSTQQKRDPPPQEPRWWFVVFFFFRQPLSLSGGGCYVPADSGSSFLSSQIQVHNIAIATAITLTNGTRGARVLHAHEVGSIGGIKL